MRRQFWIVLFCFVPMCIWSQHGNLKFGLYDLQTKSPVDGAHVFFNNTSFGTISDQKGEINLSTPLGLQEDLIISHISYDTKIIADASLRSLNAIDSIYLVPNGIQIDEIIVTQKRSKAWKKNFKRFEKAFLGTDNVASKCKILNPEVLRFDGDKDQFMTTAVDMLKIQNKYLGYNVDFLLESLTIDKNGSMKYLGHANFKDIASELNEKKIRKNRNKIYKKSPSHFFKHLIHNELNEGKYKIKLVKYINGNFQEVMTPEVKDILYYDSTSQHYLLSFDDFLQIKHLGFKERQDISLGGISQGGLESARFNSRGQGASTKISYPFSWLYKISPLLIINKNGLVVNHRAVQEYGYWANQRMAHKLPLDYGIDYDTHEEFDLKNEQKIDTNKQITKAEVAIQPDSLSSLAIIKDLLYRDPSTRENTLNKIEANWKPNYAPPLLDLLRVNQDAYLHEQLTTLLKKHAGTGNFYEGLQWLWKNDPIYDSIYDNTKAEIYQHVDPKFKNYFEDRGTSAKISLDEIVWGGVKQDGIPPLRNPRMTDAKEAEYLSDSDIVFGLSINGEHMAYPKRILAWHEFFTAEVNGQKIAGVYCTLCGTMIAYDMVHNDTFYDLGTSGFLYRSNKLMYDKETQSLWSTIDGKPVLGPLTKNQIKLKSYATITTTWGKWKELHPTSKVLSLNTGFQRNYHEGEAYKAYFSTDKLMFPVPKVDNRLKNKDEVLIIRAFDYVNDPIAISIDYLRKHNMYQGKISDNSFVVLCEDDGWSRVYDSKNMVFKSYKKGKLKDRDGNIWIVSETHLEGPNNEKLSRVASHNAFWFAWFNAYPNTRLIH